MKYERLKFLLSEMETEMVMGTWDLSVAASAGSVEIQDHFTKSERDAHPLNEVMLMSLCCR